MEICYLPNMENETSVWSRQPNEPSRWYGLFNIYRLLGPSRSISEVYRQDKRKKARKLAKSNPQKSISNQQKPAKKSTNIPGQWAVVSKRWQWKERAEAWDDYLLAEATAKEEARQAEILSTGLAVTANRVEKLKALGDLLLSELMDDQKRWLLDQKAVGTYPAQQIVDIVRFNSGIIQQFRETLDDIASEVGGRAKKMDLTSDGHSLNQSTVVVLPEKDLPPC